MSNKWRKRALLLFAGVIGLILGVYRPLATQRMLSTAGIIAGLGYFFLSQKNSGKEQDADSKEETSFDRWFLFIRMLLNFIIGGAIGSMIPYVVMLYGQ